MDIRYGQTGPSLRQEQRNRLAPSHSLCQAVCQQPLPIPGGASIKYRHLLIANFGNDRCYRGYIACSLSLLNRSVSLALPSRNTSFVFGVRRMVLLLREKEKDTRLDKAEPGTVEVYLPRRNMPRVIT